MHTYIHTYLHTYIHTYIHEYIHTYMHTVETTPKKVPKGLQGLSPALIEKVRKRQEEAARSGLGGAGTNAEVIKQRYACVYVCV
jgi:hypothetical protein